MPLDGAQPPPPSFLEKVSLVLHLPAFLLTLLFHIATKPFRSDDRKRTTSRVAFDMMMWYPLRFLSVAQLQFLSEPFPCAVKAFAKKHNLNVHAEDVAEGARVWWLGRRWEEGDGVLYFIHGNGYVSALTVLNLSFVKYLQDTYASETGRHLSIALLQYSLIGQAKWPTQISQAHAGLQHLVTSGIPPSRIIVSGDSAGAHLCTLLLSHLVHPHPSIPSPSPLPSPLAGALLISPWVTFDYTRTGSMAYNSTRDRLPLCGLAHVSSTLRTTGSWGVYAAEEPAAAPVGWWTGLDRVAGKVAVVVGAREVLWDACLTLAERMREDDKGVDVKLIVDPTGNHDSVVATDPRDGTEEVARVITTWVADALR